MTSRDATTELTAYKVNHIPPILATAPIAAPEPPCPAGKTCTTYYLHNSPTPPVGETEAQPDLPMDTTSRVAFQRFNYDDDRDDRDGLAVRKGGTVNTGDLKKYQNWRSTPAFATDFHIQGDLELHLWGASNKFKENREGEVEVFVRDWDGSSYTDIASASLFEPDWQAGFTDFIVVVLRMPGVDHVVPAGHQLDLRLVVGDDTETPNMWFMYDYIEFDSKLFVQSVTP